MHSCISVNSLPESLPGCRNGQVDMSVWDVFPHLCPWSDDSLSWGCCNDFIKSKTIISPTERKVKHEFDWFSLPCTHNGVWWHLQWGCGHIWLMLPGVEWVLMSLLLHVKLSDENVTNVWIHFLAIMFCISKPKLVHHHLLATITKVGPLKAYTMCLLLVVYVI